MNLSTKNNIVSKQLYSTPSLSGVYPHTKQIKSTSKFKLSVGVIKSLKKLDSLGRSVGVYFFKDARERIIYIGKAVNLKARVKSYFIKNFLYGIKASMLPKIAKIDYEITDTEIDALILESQLIKKYRPKYNVMLKDDKSYFYVIFTNEQFPKVFITHQPLKVKSGKRKVKNGQENIILGPYTDGGALKTTLRYLRKIFPYCTCKTTHKIPCLKSHLELCAGVCCLKQQNKLRIANSRAKEYKKNIGMIADILSGKRKGILKKLEKEMKIAAEKEDFEKAVFLRNKISALNNIFQHKIIFNYRGSTSIVEARDEISRIFAAKIDRIEFYDISNIQGELAVGSMAVFDGEKINSSEYRKFKIKTVFGADDPAMIEEILIRRLKHKEWETPKLIIVDGGITQLGAARKVLKNSKIKCASLAKNPDRLFVDSLKQIPLKNLSQDSSLFLRQLRDEAHRFAIGYHRKLRSRKLSDDFKIE